MSIQSKDVLSRLHVPNLDRLIFTGSHYYRVLLADLVLRLWCIAPFEHVYSI